MRREFWPWQQWQRTVSPVAKKVLVTLGGSDPDNVTLKVIQALQLLAVEELEVVVVVGGSNPHYNSLEIAVQNSLIPIRLQRNVTNMPELMAWADIAISAGGSTCWELAFMGLPSIVLVLAENQRAIAAELDSQGVIINLGWHQDVTIDKIGLALQELLWEGLKVETMSKKGQTLVDGNGARQVVLEIVNMLV
ncbi:PseG/SpsG family protein [Planktothricoides raciborskii]|uniref:PseG/SpsG family protein n=1 Tax=Planktothricoides raciborskii TaxID=132608 RepID=UPI0018EF7BF1|nr:glycosyltransferase [Planktothricoides raciborskii]